MFFRKKKPYETLTTVGAFYELTVLEDDDLSEQATTRVIKGEFRGWTYDHDHNTAYTVIWEQGASRAEDYHIDDIVAVKPVEV